MSVRLIKVLLFWISCLPFQSFAAVKAQVFDCDTIITTGGQVLLVQLEEGSTDAVLRFSYCGENKKNIYEFRRSLIREIHPAGASGQLLPEGSIRVVQPEGIVLPATPEQAATEKRKIVRWSNIAAIGGFGATAMFTVSLLLGSLFLLVAIPLSILGFIFSWKVLKRTYKRPEYKDRRHLAWWSMGVSLFWFVLLVLVIGVIEIIEID